MLLKACSLFGMDDDRARFACVLAEQGGLDGRPWRMRLRSPCRSQGTGQVGEGNGPRNRSQPNPSASSLCRESSEERRCGKECVRACRARWCPVQKKTKKK